MIHPLSPEDKSRIFTELITGPRPRAIDPDLKRALLQDLDVNEEEVTRGILDIVETGGASIDDLLAELERRVGSADSGT